MKRYLRSLSSSSIVLSYVQILLFLSALIKKEKKKEKEIENKEGKGHLLTYSN